MYSRGESNNLSPEQVQRLAKTISAAKDLTEQQEEIIKKVLDGETDIGKLRISSLERYFDVYSRNLDLVARKHSILNDTFLILEEKLNKNYKSLSYDVTKLEQQLASLSKHAEENSSPSQERTAKTQKENIANTSVNAVLDSSYSKNLEVITGLLIDNKKLLETVYKSTAEGVTGQDRLLNNICNIIYEIDNNSRDSLSGLTEQFGGVSERLSYVSSEQNDQSKLLHGLSDQNNEPDTVDWQSKIIGLLNNIINEAKYLQESIISNRVDQTATPSNQVERVTENIRKDSDVTANTNDHIEILTGILKAINKSYENAVNDIVNYVSHNNSGNVSATEPEKSTTSDNNKDTYSHIDTAASNANNIQDSETVKAAVPVYNEVLNDDIDKLGEARTSENIIERLKAFSDVEDQTDAIIKRQNDAVISIEQLKEARQNKRNELADEYAEKEIKLEKTLTSLAIARLQERADRDAQQRNLQISHAQKMAEAELDVEERLNEFKAKSEYSQTKDAAEFQARETNATQTLSAIDEVSKQKAAFKEQLDIESMANSDDGTLTAEDAAKNAALAEEQFENVEERIAAIRLRNMLEASNPKLVEANERKKAAAIAKYEAAERRKNNGVLDAEQKQRIKDLADKEFALSKENLEKLAKEEEKKAKKPTIAEDSKLGKIISEIKSIDDKKIIWQDPDKSSSGGEIAAKSVAMLDSAVSALSSLAAKLDSSIDKIASYQGDIDTRLQGSKNDTNFAGSYWGQLTKDMMSVGAVTPFYKQEDFANNIKSLVDRGIAFDLKQRAFLMTIQDKIANTFDVADGTLLRLVRLQQEDSTAGRLGMESALNSFLNEMYENTEYLKGVAEGVRSSLQEMEALMSGAEATEVEYQVQKWMGSLFSVGMSQEAVNNIAGALGQLAAGQVDVLTSGNGAGNLLVMAANEAGKSISEILTEGLNSTETNDLLQATVNYLAELAESSKDSKVVQQQLASVFGVKASDLRAATNLASKDSIDTIYGRSKYSIMDYDKMIGQLNTMAGTMFKRTSIGEMMTNVWENGQYSLAGSMANNPIAYLTYKMAGLLDSAAGGISLPAVSVAGFGVDLETTVADLMRVASMSQGILGSLGPMVSGLASSFSGQAMLSKMGIEQGNGLNVVQRGTGDGVGAGELLGGGTQTASSSGYVGNASGSDVKDSTVQGAEDTKKRTMIEAKEEAEATQIDFINANVLKIYELLDEVTTGKRNFTVKVANYGLTGLDGRTSLSKSQGGVDGLLSNTPANSSGNSALSGGFSNSGGGSGSTSSGGGYSGTASGSESSFGSPRAVDIGGWIIT